MTARRAYWPALRAFARTAAVLASVSDLVSASLRSALEPRAELPEHHGDTNLFDRAHFGLIVPGPPDLCGIKVEGER